MADEDNQGSSRRTLLLIIGGVVGGVEDGAGEDALGDLAAAVVDLQEVAAVRVVLGR